jgi:hypothetical protein
MGYHLSHLRAYGGISSQVRGLGGLRIAFVTIDILTHVDGIRHSGFEGEPEETASGLLVLVAYALQYLHKKGDYRPQYRLLHH